MKNVKLCILFLLSILMTVMIAGCSTTNSKNASEKPEKIEKIEPPTPNLSTCKSYTEAGNKMIVSILDGLAKDDYALYSRDFTVKSKQYFNREVFKEANKAVVDKLGTFKSKEFLGEYVKGKFHVLLWKAQYTKTKDDILMLMYVRKDKDTYKVSAFLVK